MDFSASLVTLFTVGKKSSQENRNYLRMWSQENKSKAKNSKDLPRLNQVLLLIRIFNELYTFFFFLHTYKYSYIHVN